MAAIFLCGLLVAIGGDESRARADEAPRPPAAPTDALPAEAKANAPAADHAEGEGIEFFERKVRPLLAQRCFECHTGENAKGSLHLDSKAGVLAGGDTGPAIVPGKPQESLLVDAVNYGDTYQMPPKSKLGTDEVAVLTRWVEIGAPWPAEQDAAKVNRSKFDLAERKAAHWAWQPIGSPEPPAVRDEAWPAGAVDRFVLARLESEGMQPAPAAERRALVRRLYFDLVGLPPTADELNAVLADESPGAIERLVDRLLASPHFGERWGRHWLDLVRYTESRGHEYDPPIPNAWQYRDYVVRAINADLPYDQFLSEHLAGDLISPPRLHPTAGFNESILGTGFWLLEEAGHSPVDIHQDETDRINERLDVASKTFLAMTVACARCHDHKFDAISQRDYYALSGFAISGTYRQVRFETLERERQLAEQLGVLRDRARGELLPLAAEILRPAIERVGEYLLAAGEVLWPSEAKGDASGDASGEAARVAALAGERKLDARQLSFWVAEVRSALGSADHPLRRFARAAENRNGAADSPAPPPPAESAETKAVEDTVIADYAAASTPWYANGFSFGLRPVRPGDILPAADANSPLRLATWGAAARDPAWFGLKTVAGNEVDYGTLGKWDRAGQTLRTPETTLATGKLWYLVRGAGRAYAVVNSHLMVDGPLHGQTLLEWKAGDGADAGGGWRWIRHDLSAYPGHRTHVEFSPVGDEPLAIARVIDAPSEPRPVRQAVDAAGSPVAGEGPLVERLAAACQQSFAKSIARLNQPAADGANASQTLSADNAALADWLLTHLEQLAPLDGASGDERAARERLAAATSAFRAAEAALAGAVPKESHLAPAMLEGNGFDEPLLIRGNSRTPGETVPRRPLEAFDASANFDPGAGSGRLELARALVAADNPLVARVMVNRVWHHLFGLGIVPTVDNFGVLGQTPSHPELLDYLARGFMANGWSLKRLIRELVLSRTYQMSSYPQAADERDPNDVLLHRMRLRRLEGEAIRDAILTVSGRLDPTLFGPSVPIHLTADLDGRGRPKESGPLDGRGRRSLYLSVRRNFPSPMLSVFDMPVPATTMGRRNVSNVPAQALILLNDPFVDEQAVEWARRALAVDLAPPERITRLYEAAIGRPPGPGEFAAAIEFLQRQAAEMNRPDDWQRDERVWADLAHVMWNSKEFLFVR
ncbi:MAG TPA: PSD1 and planctomycete cytochrome C domain-containing protein [Pirellulales bacterium]|nr:PSD1 and planctomycete cytochrome C domain-containing protein [Pirellulales bacterium]